MCECMYRNLYQFRPASFRLLTDKISISFQGVKIHYVEKGDPSKPLMLFVHGFPEFWYSWRYQITEFSKDYR